MHERSLVSVKVEPRSTSRLLLTFYILPLFYLRDLNFLCLTCVGKNASVEINLYSFLLGGTSRREAWERGWDNTQREFETSLS